MKPSTDKIGLRFLTYGTVLSTYVLIVIGGYVVFSGSGLGCGSNGAESWPLCNGKVIPPLSGAPLVEWTHRLFTLVTGLFVLGTTIVVWTKYREEKTILQFSTLTFLILIGQVLLGMVTVRTDLDKFVSTAHLAVASALFASVIVNALTVRRFTLLSREVAG